MSADASESVSQRLHRGQVWRDGQTIVGVMQVALAQDPPKALISLTDRTVDEPLADHVELAIGESAPVGDRRFTLVDMQRGEQKAFVEFRLEPDRAAGENQ